VPFPRAAPSTRLATSRVGPASGLPSERPRLSSTGSIRAAHGHGRTRRERQAVCKSGLVVHVHDKAAGPMERLSLLGAAPARSVAALGSAVDAVFLSSIVQVEAYAKSSFELRPSHTHGRRHEHERRGTNAQGCRLHARSRHRLRRCTCSAHRRVAVNGTLFIGVGATPERFATMQALLAHMGTDVLPCGPAGCGQIVKILNNIMEMMTATHCRRC
jgi:hypothetical protein